MVGPQPTRREYSVQVRLSSSSFSRVSTTTPSSCPPSQASPAAQRRVGGEGGWGRAAGGLGRRQQQEHHCCKAACVLSSEHTRQSKVQRHSACRAAPAPGRHRQPLLRGPQRGCPAAHARLNTSQKEAGLHRRCPDSPDSRAAWRLQRVQQLGARSSRCGHHLPSP
jgi:hypothetical protein